MATVSIIDRGCRGCTLCVDICPVDVFEQDQGTETAKVMRQDDCIGCLSCYYACPSQCVEVGDVEMLRPFHRIEDNVAFIEKFLQEKTATTSLSPADFEEANADVAARLIALGEAVVETMGRGHKAVGRRAGAMAASHMPEMYEEKGLDDIIRGMQRKFEGAFVFDYAVDGGTVDLTFKPCGLCQVVENAGETVGEATLCEIFHEYWAGLLTAYVGETYKFEVPKAGQICEMKLFPAR
jgi:NAD-dependent dihydropyrimidine dehydrogenase PreA subunit